MLIQECAEASSHDEKCARKNSNAQSFRFSYPWQIIRAAWTRLHPSMDIQHPKIATFRSARICNVGHAAGLSLAREEISSGSPHGRATRTELRLRLHLGQSYQLLARFAAVNFCGSDQDHGRNNHHASGKDVPIEALVQHQPSQKNGDRRDSRRRRSPPSEWTHASATRCKLCNRSTSRKPPGRALPSAREKSAQCDATDL